jgi:hypothetical protein
VLEIKIGAGAFTDILAAGGSFAANGYTRTISSGFGNPLGGRQAWSGNSGGFVMTRVNLPAAAAGQTVQFRWRCGSDNNNALSGWRIDSVNITVQTCCDISAPPPPPVLQGIEMTSGVVAVSGYAAPGHTYRLQYKNDLSDSDWTDIAPDIVATNSTIVITDVQGAASQRFYRIYRVQ